MYKWSLSGVILLLNFTRVYFVEEPLTLGHEDFDGFSDEDIRGQDAGGLHRNWRGGRHGGRLSVGQRKPEPGTFSSHISQLSSLTQTNTCVRHRLGKEKCDALRRLMSLD